MTMSHKWTANVFGYISDGAMNKAREAIEKFPFFISHDNVNLPLRVFSQRLHNQSHFMSGCAATVWVLPLAAQLSPDANRSLQKHRTEASTTCFEYSNILYRDDEVNERLEAQNIHHILAMLLDSPNFMDYQHCNHPALEPPPPVHQLNCGPETTAEQYILGTAAIEEASYDGNDKVVEEWFRQLHLNSDEEKLKTGLERIIPWVGDQMTVERLRGLWRYRHEDFNSFDRMDYMIPIFGWFHLVMAFANSLHKQYLGTSAGIGGLRQAIDVLKRKGLRTVSTKGPFWHHLNEALHHIGEAHLRASWLAISGATCIADLKQKTPAEL